MFQTFLNNQNTTARILSMRALVVLGVFSLSACMDVADEPPVTDVVSTPAPVVVVVPPPPPMPVPNPKTFMGKGRDAITVILGDPSFVRRDPPAELWQFRSKECIIDLYFYEDGGDNYKVEYVDFRNTLQSSDAKDGCLRVIITQAGL